METKTEARLYERLPGGRVRCATCCRRCVIAPGRLGWCRARRNESGRLFSLEYGLVSSLSVNPIEKKPLYHFYPGTSFLTVGSWSCTFDCPWCQNWDISKTAPDEGGGRSRVIGPDELVAMAKSSGCRGTSMSFSEPTTFLEYAADVFRLARAAGLANTVIANGYFTAEAAELLLENGADAFNIDVKGDAEVYERHCKADAERVWENIRRLRGRAHVEVTTLVIPGVNDGEGCLRGIARRVRAESGAETPWHVTGYYPAYRFEARPTPVATLERAHDIGREEGLWYVYVGNVDEHRYANTWCPRCGEELIARRGLAVVRNRLGREKKCPGCGEEIAIIC